MNAFLVLTFLHVTGSIAIFISWALEYNHLAALKKSAPTIPDEFALNALKKYKKIGSIGVLITLASGIWLMIAVWGRSSWIMMAFASIVLIIITEVFCSRKAMAFKTDTLRSMAYQISSIRFRIAIGIGIIALMVFKTPDILLSVIIVLVSLAAGAIWVLPLFKKVALS